MNKLMDLIAKELTMWVYFSNKRKDVTLDTFKERMERVHDIDVMVQFETRRTEEFEVLALIDTGYNVSFVLKAVDWNSEFEPVRCTDLVSGVQWTYGYLFDDADVENLIEDERNYTEEFRYMMERVIKNQ